MRKRSLILLGATWLAVALITKTTPESAHEYSRLGTVESLVHRGTYRLDDSTFIDTLDKVFRNGHFYSHQPPLLATLEAPVYWAMQLPGLRFNNRGRALSVFLFSLLTNGLALALTVVVLRSTFGLAGVPSPTRDVYAVLLPFGTWLLPYGVVTNNHGISGLLLAVVAYQLLSLEWRGVSSRRCGWLGVSLGLLAAIEILPLVSFVPLAIGYLFARRDVTLARWRVFGAGLAIPLAAHAVLNVPITGDIVPAGFHPELFTYPGSAFDESSLSGSFKHRSLPEFSAYAWQALVAGKGYFTFAPVLGLGLFVGVAGWRWWARARGAQLVLLGGVVASLAASLLTTNNFGGGAVGFRHATYLAPAMLTLLLPVLTGRGGAARAASSMVAAVAALSMIVLLLVAVRNPWTSLSLPPQGQCTWEECFPIVARVVGRDLFRP